MVGEEKLVEALVKAVEARDGADAAGVELWYFRQGRIARELANQLNNQQRTTAAELRQLAQLMRAEFSAGLTKADVLGIQQRVRDTGFTQTEMDRLLEIITPEVVEDFRQWFAGHDFSDLPNDLIGAIDDSATGIGEFAGQLADHKVLNPDTQNVLKIYLTGTFGLPWPASTYRPHNVDVLVNGNLAAKLTDTVPNGTYLWEADSSFLNYTGRGVAPNTIMFQTSHLNGGHYVVSEKVKLTLQLSQIAISVVAASQEEANALVYGLPGVSPGAPDVAVHKGDLSMLGIPNDRDPVSVRIRVRNIGNIYVGAASISLYAGDPDDGGTLISQTSTPLEPFDTKTFNMQWRPAEAGDVTLYVVADPAEGEKDTGNNTIQLNVTVDHVMPGDVNADQKVNIVDIITIRNSLNKSAAEHPEADLNNDGRINIVDMLIVRSYLGRMLNE